MLADRVAQIQTRIATACHQVGRAPDSVTLVAVSKTYSVAAIQEAYDAGIRHFGESRLQEALPKMEALPGDIHWHFIGNLQSNKARKIAERFGTIHTVWNERQLAEIAKADARPNVFVEVNLGREPQKSGLLPENLDVFVQLLLQWESTRFYGLMAIGPVAASPSEKQELFAQARILNQQVGGRYLSLGMSGDFELAIQEGSTHVRIGTALFGERS